MIKRMRIEEWILENQHTIMLSILALLRCVPESCDVYGEKKDLEYSIETTIKELRVEYSRRKAQEI
jgi:hypothetical protein